MNNNVLKKGLDSCLELGQSEIIVNTLKPIDGTLMPALQVGSCSEAQAGHLCTNSCSGLGDGRSSTYLGQVVYVEGGFRYLEQEVTQAVKKAREMRVTTGNNTFPSSM